MADSIPSTIKLLRPEDVWQPKVGAPRGNRNRAGKVLPPDPLEMLRRRIRDLKARHRKLRAKMIGQRPAPADDVAT